MLGYLAIELHGDAYVGGVLVVDEHGLPLEFRHTQPVRPSLLQRTLYGGALDRYVRGTVVARRLVDELEHPPQLIVADDPALLGPSEPPLAVLAEGGVEPVGSAGTTVPLDGANPGFLLQLRPAEAPLRVLTRAPQHLHGDLARLLLKTAELSDLREPLDRVRQAIALVAREAQRPAA